MTGLQNLFKKQFTYFNEFKQLFSSFSNKQGLEKVNKTE